MVRIEGPRSRNWHRETLVDKLFLTCTPRALVDTGRLRQEISLLKRSRRRFIEFDSRIALQQSWLASQRRSIPVRG